MSDYAVLIRPTRLSDRHGGLSLPTFSVILAHARIQGLSPRNRRKNNDTGSSIDCLDPRSSRGQMSRMTEGTGGNCQRMSEHLQFLRKQESRGRSLAKKGKTKALDPRSEPVLDVCNRGSGMTKKDNYKRQWQCMPPHPALSQRERVERDSSLCSE